jgi:iron-sulfur cluster repair protein YtfE (RIC family)
MSPRRHDSLIPLSREHHYALVVCLRINRGLPGHISDSKWLEERVAIVRDFFPLGLKSHFECEEENLFPAMSEVSGAHPLIEELLEEHRKLDGLVRFLVVGTYAVRMNKLSDFSRLLESHIRKEERQLFPLFEQQVPAEVQAQVGVSIVTRIGEGRQTRNSDLLR